MFPLGALAQGSRQIIKHHCREELKDIQTWTGLYVMNGTGSFPGCQLTVTSPAPDACIEPMSARGKSGC